MKVKTLRTIACLIGVGVSLAAAPRPAVAGSAGNAVDAKAAFEKLKGMVGTWQGEFADESGAMQSLEHEFRLSANGSVVMETMNPGTEHEMINMYHLDGDDLVLTHYCAGANQPTMKLDRAHASATDLPFAFTGGTNFDPAKDPHIHDARLVFRADGRVDSVWTSYAGGKEDSELTFTLTRSGS